MVLKKWVAIDSWVVFLFAFLFVCVVDSKQTMEDPVLVGDDLMMGHPSPIIPPELASHVLQVLICVMSFYGICFYDKELRQRLEDSEQKLGMSMPVEQAKERCNQLESEATLLEGYGHSTTKTWRLILASGVEGIEGFRQRWSLHGRLTDTK